MSFPSLTETVFLLLCEGKTEKGKKYQGQGGDENPIWLSNVHLYTSLKQTSFTILGPLR